MSRTVELRSAKDGTTLTFTRLSQPGREVTFECRYVSPRFSGTVQASTYYVPPPSSFFAALSENWKNEQTWQDINGIVSLSSHADSLGHIFVNIELRHYDEKVSGELELELGQLDAIAESARKVFGFDATHRT